jgi:3-phosphoshikimate 1-carboxyvinyltransferase
MGVAVSRGGVATDNGEPRADLSVAWAPLAPFEIGGDLVVRAIDELPLLAILAARAAGPSRIRDAAELRVKESDRIAKTAELLRSFGVPVDEHADGWTIHGDPERPLTPGRVDAHGDHRIAMGAYLLGLIAPAGTVVTGAEAIATSFPTFSACLAALGAPAARLP